MSRARLRLRALSYAALALVAAVASTSLFAWAAASRAPGGIVAALVCLIGSAFALRAWDATTTETAGERHSDGD